MTIGGIVAEHREELVMADVGGYRGPVRAPDFPGGLEWFNVSRPLRLADLRGKIVILDFWTYC